MNDFKWCTVTRPAKVADQLRLEKLAQDIKDETGGEVSKETKLIYLFDTKYSCNSLSMERCAPDMIKVLEGFRDKKYSQGMAKDDRETGYLYMMAFILEDLGLLDISRTFLSSLDEVTEEGLEILKDEVTLFYEQMLGKAVLE